VGVVEVFQPPESGGVDGRFQVLGQELSELA